MDSWSTRAGQRAFQSSPGSSPAHSRAKKQALGCPDNPTACVLGSFSKGTAKTGSKCHRPTGAAHGRGARRVSCGLECEGRAPLHSVWKRLAAGCCGFLGRLLPQTPVSLYGDLLLPLGRRDAADHSPGPTPPGYLPGPHVGTMSAVEAVNLAGHVGSSRHISYPQLGVLVASLGHPGPGASGWRQAMVADVRCSLVMV